MTWVTRDTKARFAALARHQGITTSALLKRLVDASLAPTTVVKPQSPDSVEPVVASGRLSIRLRADDLLLLRERAKGREMPTSTYVSLLVRSHLRSVTPLPTAELVVTQAQCCRDQCHRAEHQSDRPRFQSRRARQRPGQRGPLHATSGAQRPADSHQGTHQREPRQLADRL